MSREIELKMSQQEFEDLDNVLMGHLNKNIRLAIIRQIDQLGFSKKPTRIEMDEEALAEELHKENYNAYQPSSKVKMESNWKRCATQTKIRYIKMAKLVIQRFAPVSLPSVEAIAKAAYEQHMKNAKVEGKWELNLTEIGKEQWMLVGQVIRTLMEKGVRE